MRDTTKKLLLIIDQYINQSLNYNDFYSKFNDIVHEAPDIDDEEAHLEWGINDRVAYAGEDPIDKESRKDGYIGPEEFRVWLKDYKQKNIHFWEK